MFLAIVFIILGAFLLLNAFGIIVGGNFWALVCGAALLAIGLKLLMKRGRCPICGMHYWEGKMHSKIHEAMHDHERCCGHDHGADGEDHH